jgi:two-component system chemotaxis sensor kinase CheA
MGGRVEIESMLGIGTRMTVRLPLTLAILDGMSVAVGDQTYILPLGYVVESLQPERAMIKTMANQGRVIQVRNEYLPVVVLHEVFGHADGRDRLHAGHHGGPRSGRNQGGAVRRCPGRSAPGGDQEPGGELPQGAGISGATIMGDGHVALILDVDYAGTFGQLKDDTNTTVERLREVVGQIKEASESINTAAQEIAAGNSDL